jgi:hypothetical protein
MCGERVSLRTLFFSDVTVTLIRFGKGRKKRVRSFGITVTC